MVSLPAGSVSKTAKCAEACVIPRLFLARHSYIPDCRRWRFDSVSAVSATYNIVICNNNISLKTKSSATVETAIQGHSRSSVVVPIHAEYMTSY